MLPPPSPSTTHGSDLVRVADRRRAGDRTTASKLALIAPLRGSSENRLPARSPTRIFGFGTRVGSPIEGAPSGLREGTVDQSPAPVAASRANRVFPATARALARRHSARKRDPSRERESDPTGGEEPRRRPRRRPASRRSVGGIDTSRSSGAASGRTGLRRPRDHSAQNAAERRRRERWESTRVRAAPRALAPPRRREDRGCRRAP